MIHAGSTDRDSVLPGTGLVRNVGAVPSHGASGPVWALDSPQLNVNLIRLNAGDVIQEHRNDEVDVLLIIQTGRGRLWVDGHLSPLRGDFVALIQRGSVRKIEADTSMHYYSVHQRRAPLTIRWPT